MMEMSKLNRMALQTLSTSKVSSHLSAIPIIMALIKSKNKPSVIKVSGIVMMIKSGFKVAFNMPSIMATPMAAGKEAIVTPGKIQSATNTANELTTSRISKTGF